MKVTRTLKWGNYTSLVVSLAGDRHRDKLLLVKMGLIEC